MIPSLRLHWQNFPPNIEAATKAVLKVIDDEYLADIDHHPGHEPWSGSCGPLIRGHKPVSSVTL